MSFLSFIQAMFIILKVANVTDASWVWVFSPVWMTATAFAVIVVVTHIVLKVTGNEASKIQEYVDKIKRRK